MFAIFSATNLPSSYLLLPRLHWTAPAMVKSIESESDATLVKVRRARCMHDPLPQWFLGYGLIALLESSVKLDTCFRCTLKDHEPQGVTW